MSMTRGNQVLDWRCSCLLLIVLAACSPAASRSPSAKAGSTSAATESGFEPVAFLAGDWEGTTRDGRFDEHWTTPRAGIMLGVGREVGREGALTFFEFLRIERHDADLVLIPQPQGRPGQDFKLVRSKASAVVFENAGGDHLRSISYVLAGDELVARLVFRDADRTEEVRMRRIH